MSHNQVRLFLSDVDSQSTWFRYRNINKLIQKLWKKSIIGTYIGKYEGEWKDGQIHGKGALRIYRIFRGSLGGYDLTPFGWKLIDQGNYEGEWKNGLFHGKGIRIFPSGEKYEGEWTNGKHQGQGTFYSSCGGKLVGRFKKGIPWNTTDFDKDQNFVGLHIRGLKRNIIHLKPTLPSPLSNPH